MAGIEHRVAAGIVERALGAVYDPAVVRTLREDSPLAALGTTPADAVCISDAIFDAAADFGCTCTLTDSDFVGVETVADLVSAVAREGVPA